uniref:Helicase-associated domain-containing protein n=1 Tax=Helicotheca tamesis TaxID=374047 RepID=A0A7S2HWS7_9STRA|mmetsp:Transcript_3092/g.4182  ORF Transcript_3092/g.4182 Transcript_3092/m.4182 type:complete len:118 (+) Transcript_3092:541-894(+)
MTRNHVTSSNSSKSVEDVKENTWHKMLDQLKKYRDEHGDCLVPYRYKHNKALGRWVYNQRYQYTCLQQGKRTQMTQEHVDKLNKLGFVWKLAKRKTWFEMLDELKMYNRKYGDCIVH